MPIWNTFGTVAVRDFWENGCDVIVLWLDSLRKMSALQLFAKRKKAETGLREGHLCAQRRKTLRMVYHSQTGRCALPPHNL